MADTREPNHYEVLQVPEHATLAAMRRSYRRLAAELHPDTHPGPQATANMARLNAAWRTLSDPARRAEYDATRAPECDSCGLRLGLFQGHCRVCIVQDGPSADSTPDRPRRFNAALWSVRVHAALEACTTEIAAVLGAHAAQIAQGPSELSDWKLEATVALGDAGETAQVGARLWQEGPRCAALRVSVAASLPWGEACGEAERLAFDRLVLGLARDTESRLRDAGLRFETAA